MRQGTSRNAVELVFCRPSISGHSAYPEEHFISLLCIPWRKLNFHLHVVQILTFDVCVTTCQRIARNFSGLLFMEILN